MTPFAAAQHYKLLVQNQAWDTDSAIAVTCSFTTGSCNLSVYKPTETGLEWAKTQKDTQVNPNDPDYN